MMEYKTLVVRVYNRSLMPYRKSTCASVSRAMFILHLIHCVFTACWAVSMSRLLVQLLVFCLGASGEREEGRP
jgi:hypothetical protein